MSSSKKNLGKVVWWHNVNVSARPELVTLAPLICLHHQHHHNDDHDANNYHDADFGLDPLIIMKL